MFTTTTAPLAQRGPDGLAVIGSTRHQLMGIRYNNGENGAGGGNDDAAAQAAAAAGSKPPWGDDPSKFDPDKAWQLIQNVKGDLAAEKQKRDDAIAAAIADARDLSDTLHGVDEDNIRFFDVGFRVVWRPRSLMFPIKRVAWRGRQVSVPNKMHTVSRLLYGDSYNTAVLNRQDCIHNFWNGRAWF